LDKQSPQKGEAMNCRAAILLVVGLCVFCIVAACGDKDKETTVNTGGGEWVLVDAAKLDGDRIVLTPDLPDVAGGAFYTATFDLEIDFDLKFAISLGDKDDEGADGIVFVIATEDVTAQTGEGLGYQGIVPSIGIEIDTYPNDGEHLGGDLGDPLADHIAVDVDGSADHHGSDRPLVEIDNIEDGQEHDFRVVWTTATGVLEVYLDDLQTPLLTYDENFIDQNLDGGNLVRLGFTGSTGAFSNVQYIVPVVFQSNR
jgi:hypothetical protein